MLRGWPANGPKKIALIGEGVGLFARWGGGSPLVCKCHAGRGHLGVDIPLTHIWDTSPRQKLPLWPLSSARLTRVARLDELALGLGEQRVAEQAMFNWIGAFESNRSSLSYSATHVHDQLDDLVIVVALATDLIVHPIRHR